MAATLPRFGRRGFTDNGTLAQGVSPEVVVSHLAIYGNACFD